MSKPRAIIVGGGVSGLCTAYALTRRNFDLHIINAEFKGKATPVSGGILAPLYPWRAAAETHALIASSKEKFAGLFGEIQQSDAFADGHIHGAIYLDVDEQAAAKTWCQKNACSFNVLDAKDLEAFGVSQECGFLLRDTERIDAASFLVALEALLRRSGVDFIEQAATAIQDNGVRLDDGKTISADYVVVCAGAWSAKLLPESEVRPIKGQMLELAGIPRKLCFMLLADENYLIPQRDGRCFVGSTVEDVGFDTSTTDDASGQLLGFVRRVVAAEPELVAHRTGLRPFAQRPLISRVPSAPNANVFINSGLFRNGVACAPAAAELVAELICGETPHIDPAPFSLA